jgi:hypothetical protein
VYVGQVRHRRSSHVPVWIAGITGSRPESPNAPVSLFLADYLVSTNVNDSLKVVPLPISLT